MGSELHLYLWGMSMKVVVFNGSPRKGNTYAATQIIKSEMIACGDVRFIEHFLPNDLPEFCAGCFLCLSENECLCPHSKYTLPILENLLDADALIFTTPVYVLQTTGAVKAFFDHYSWMFIVHILMDVYCAYTHGCILCIGRARKCLEKRRLFYQLRQAQEQKRL